MLRESLKFPTNISARECRVSQSFKFMLAISGLLGAGEFAVAAQPPDVVQSDVAQNTAMGSYALANMAEGFNNTAAGAEAGNGITTGGNNVAIGFSTMVGGNGPMTGSDNVGVGILSLAGNTSGNFNTAVGGETMLLNLGGSHNVAVGYAALNLNRSGSYNEAIGRNALLSNSTGNYNLAMGGNSLYNNKASNNIGFGYASLFSNTSGDSNTASGFNAMFSNTTGRLNLALGASALYSNSTGSSNIAVGPSAGTNITGSNNIDIGAPGASSESGIIRIGVAGTHTAVYVSGISSTQVTGANVVVTANGQLGVLASSERYKVQIASMGDGTQKLSQLRPVSFHLKKDLHGSLQYGLIAEEVAKVYPELVIRDSRGQIQGVRYDELAPMLLNEVQKQQRELQDERLELAELRQQNQAVLAALAKLQATDPKLALR
jgi:hypothetical protein